LPVSTVTSLSYTTPWDTICGHGSTTVKDQVHIRNAEAAQLARALARESGKTISEVVLEALRQYRPGRRERTWGRELAQWRRLLREDRKRGLVQSETAVEALYDPATGLPA
jgi:hypothetical protein